MDINQNRKTNKTDLVRWDYILRSKDYKFIYILDADDVKTYCDPFGHLYEGRSEEPKKSTEIISDYDHVFHDFVEKNANNIILPRYYHGEIGNLRDLISKNHSADRFLIGETLKDLDSFLVETESSDSVTPKDALDFILQKYSVYDTFMRNNSISIIQKLTDLFKDKVMFEDDIEAKFDDKVVKLFNIAERYMQRPSSRHDIRFIQGELGGYKSYENDAYSIYLTLILNHLSGCHKLGYIFIFFSSTPVVEKEFPKIREKSNWSFLKPNQYLSSALDSELSIVKHYSFLRGKNHLLLNSSFQSYVDFDLRNWEMLENYVDKQFSSITNYYNEITENIGFINKKIGGRGVDGFMKDLEKFKASVSNKNSDLQQIGSMTSKLIDLFKDVEGDYKESIHGAYLQSIFLRKEYFFEFKSQLRLGNAELVLDRGLDKTDSLFNVMPCLFLFQKTNPIAEKAVGILESIFRQDMLYENDLNFPQSKIKQLLDLEIPVRNDSWASFVILPYVLMLIKFDDSNGRNSNMIVRKWLKEIIQVFKDFKRLDDSFIEVLPEIYILLCWATRRTRHYKEAYELNKAILGHEWAINDPRFHQSISLISHSWIVEYDKDEYENPYPPEVNYSSIIKHTKMAFELFNTLSGNIVYSSEYIGLVKSVLTNNIATFICSDIEDKFDGKPTEELKQQIVIARNYLNETKTSRQKDNSGENWPIAYLHTEAYTEYWELVLGTRKNGGDVKTGYKYALRDISMAIKRLRENLSPLRKFLLKDCEDMLFRLQKLNLEDILLNSKDSLNNES